MQIPKKIPGLRLTTVIVVIYAVIWISLEGKLWQSMLLAASVTLISTGYLIQRLMGGRYLACGSLLVFAAVAGLLVGLTFGILVLAAMAVKTGLHGHGPEFSPDEIDWVLSQILLWIAVTFFGALGLATLALGLGKYEAH